MIDNEPLYTCESFGLDASYPGPEPISAAEIIQEDYMEPLGLSGAALAKLIKVSPSSVNRMLNGSARLTAEMAVKICAVVGGSPAVLLRIEADYQLTVAQANIDVSQYERVMTST